MAPRTVHLACLVSLLALTSANKEQTRWSRQISTYTSDISDWIPLRGPVQSDVNVAQPQIKRQAVAEPRILTEPFPGPGRSSAFSTDEFTRNYFNSGPNRQLYLQSVPSVPSAPQNYLTDQGFGQNIRFGISQPSLTLNQGFISPPYGFDNVPPAKLTRPITMNQLHFQHSPPISQPVQGKPYANQAHKSNLDGTKYVDGYRAENTSDFSYMLKKPQSLQKIKYVNLERNKEGILPQHSKSEREEEVQLLYVPVQQLNKGQMNFRRPGPSTQLLAEPFNQIPHRLQEHQKPSVHQLNPFSGTNYFSDFNAQLKEVDQVSKFTTLTTPYTTVAPITAKPKKLKPHQPPLAIFVVKDVTKNSQVKVSDVLMSLKNADTVAVLDSVNPSNAPKVFIGPSNLPPPENFVKFELPYLSNIEHSDNKLKQLPFFVAPLSYNTPQGFAKIPFPSPHVGSVVINSQIKETAEPAPMSPNLSLNQNYYAITPPSRKVEPQTQKPTFSYYSTAAPTTKPLQNYNSNYYSFEPQSVSSLKPPSQPETQTRPPIRPPNQAQSQMVTSIPNYQSNYYSLEPQHISPVKQSTQSETQTVPPIRPPSHHQTETIAPIRPPYQHQSTFPPVRPSQPETQTAPPRTGSFFHNNPSSQYSAQHYPIHPPQNKFKSSEAIDQHNFPRQPEYKATLRTTTTTSTTSKPPSTYPSQLLETHNPYSINQAFHFSTPLDYHNYFDDVKQPYATPEQSSPSTSAPGSKSNLEPRREPTSTEKPLYQQQLSPTYLNNYTPEIHYNSEQSLKYPVYNPNEYEIKNEASQQIQPNHSGDNIPINKYHDDEDIPITNNKFNTNEDIQIPNSKYNTNEDIRVPNNKYNTNEDIHITNNKYNTNEDIQVTNNKYNANEDNSHHAVNNYNVNTYDNKYATSIDPHSNNYNSNIEPQKDIYENQYRQTNDQTAPEQEKHTDNVIPTIEGNTQNKDDSYNIYPDSDVAEVIPSSSTTTTTTTTRRTPLRTRGRPRYTTTPRSDSYESTSRVVVTKRPIRDRRPLPSRTRYEPNKISTEKPIRKPVDSSESTTKSSSSRSRTRGRIHYKPATDNDQGHYDRKKTHNSKEDDLAYQRDILHQNYPVTLMERASTVDIEAMTEPTLRQSSVNSIEHATEPIDTENAYTNERLSISEHEAAKDGSPSPTFTTRHSIQTETPYVPNLPSTRNDEHFYQSRSSIAPVEASAFEYTDNEKEEDIYAKPTTPVTKPTKSDTITYTTEHADMEQNAPDYSSSKESTKLDDITTRPETTKTVSDNVEYHENVQEENIVQTTPSYNRVRVRPGVIRQYHQSSSTESIKNNERRRPPPPVTYRPATDRRRTTMRIDEIEADLKTKQVHSRPEQEYRHPVYKPEPSTEATVASVSTTEGTTKRGHFRRRRPLHTTISTESATTKRAFEVKNRFRGRRPTEKPTEKPDVQTEEPTSTPKSSLHNRYSHRPRLSERYNKKPETEVEADQDQDSNYSINRPKYVEPNTDQWSPKISIDSFKPYNPNEVVDEFKTSTTERRSDKESELDIITARNEFEDILLTVTPSSNNRVNKKISDIPPTLEALVEQSKVTKSDDKMSTFETMLEEVMKTLEEQDKDEYTYNVMKHKGGEIGEIPPERIISSEDGYAPKTTMPYTEPTTAAPTSEKDSDYDDKVQDEPNVKNQRRGFWKKVKVRPVKSEAIEFAESQYYTNTVNRLGQPINEKTLHKSNDKVNTLKVTTYKPKYEFKDILPTSDDITNIDYTTLDINKIKSTNVSNDDEEETLINEESQKTTVYAQKESQTISPGDLDLGTGAPDPTIDDLYLTTPTESTTTKSDKILSFIDFIFGGTSENDEKYTTEEENNVISTTQADYQINNQTKSLTTESVFIPEEITASPVNEDATELVEFSDIMKVSTVASKTDKSVENTTVVPVIEAETSTVSSFMDPSNVLSTSMSTEISHETEICFRGKCIKTNKDIL